MTLAAGRLRHRISIESLDDLLDTSGGVIQDPDSGEVSQEWQLVAEVWGAIEPLSGREFIAAQAIQSKVSGRITIRHREVNPAWRIVHNGTIYNIEGVLPDKDSGLEYLTLIVSAGVNKVGQ